MKIIKWLLIAVGVAVWWLSAFGAYFAIYSLLKFAMDENSAAMVIFAWIVTVSTYKIVICTTKEWIRPSIRRF